MADDIAQTFIVTFPKPDPDALDTALRECPTDNEMLAACLFAAEEITTLCAAGDALADALRAETVNGAMAVFNETFKALTAWTEARRG